MGTGGTGDRAIDGKHDVAVRPSCLLCNRGHPPFRHVDGPLASFRRSYNICLKMHPRQPVLAGLTRRGRPPVPKKAYVPHLPRPSIGRTFAAHVTLKLLPRVESLRTKALYARIRSAFVAGCDRFRFRLVQYSVQRDHIHLVVEAEGRITLMRGIRGLAIRVAKAINHDLARRGPVFAERYHARALPTPREVRNAFVYVIQSWRKHMSPARGIDPLSSARWFGGWKTKPPRPDDIYSPPWEYEKPLVRPPSTWLASAGWRRHGLIAVDEQPAQQLGPPRGGA